MPAVRKRILGPVFQGTERTDLSPLQKQQRPATEEVILFINIVPSPLEGEGQGEGETDRIFTPSFILPHPFNSAQDRQGEEIVLDVPLVGGVVQFPFTPSLLSPVDSFAKPTEPVVSYPVKRSPVPPARSNAIFP